MTLEIANSRPFPCLRCGSRFQVVYPNSAEERGRVLGTRQRGGMVAAIKLIRDLTYCDLRDAKATAMHLVIEKGQCHWCGKSIPIMAISDCPHCRSLNIDLDV